MGKPAPVPACSQLRRDQRGGAISLWVVLMVPVAAFAAVVAMAGPQRMAAESSMEEAAGDLATLAVVLRDGRTDPDHLDDLDQQEGQIEGFLPDCPQIGIPSPLPSGWDLVKLQDQQADLEKVCNLLLGDGSGTGEAYLRRDLGYLGINTNSWEGFYSDSVLNSVGGACKISDTRQTKDAVYVALAGDWEDGGWAAAQAWPDGVRLGDEMVARLNLANKDTTLTDCSTLQFDPSKNLNPNPPRTVISD